MTWTRRSVAAASGAALLLLSLPALAAPPEPAPAVAPVLPPEPAPVPVEATPIAAEPLAPAPAPEPALTGEALRIVEGPAPAPAPAPDPTIVVPAPVVEPVACEPVAPPYISKRPSVGTGMLVGGASLMTVASVMIVLATVGRNEAGLRRGAALPLGLSAVPIAAVGVGAMISGIKANQKYTRWVADNHLDAPGSGNGMIASGIVIGAAGAISMGFAIDHNRRTATPDLGDRMLTGLTGTILAGGVMLAGGGVIQRSRFAAWEGMGYVRPGFYAGRGGAGLTLSGRF